MKKLLNFRTYLDISLAVLIIGGLVYALGFGVSLYIAHKEIKREASEKIESDMKYIESYVDGQLQRVEDVAFTLISSKFGGTSRSADGQGFVTIDPTHFRLPTEDEVFQILEQFLNANPHVCGVAIGFEPFVYPQTAGQYGFAAYVTNIGGDTEHLRLGEMHDFRQKEWYREAAQTNKSYWSHPFRETSHGAVVTCFSLPLHGYGNRLVGVLAVDINTAAFRDKCNEVAPFAQTEVTLVDQDFRFISHPDTTYLLRSVAEVGAYDDYEADDSMRIKMEHHQSGNYTINKASGEDSYFYFSPIPRTGWTLSVECPEKQVLGGVERMKFNTLLIAIASLLAMIVCFIFIIRRQQQQTISRANLEGELHLASAIQMGMIPKLYPAFPDIPELDICGFLKPAKSVGGDLYDYFVRDGRLYFCIGDVSGKGVPASLFMMVVLSLFRSIAQTNDNPAEILNALNSNISRGNTKCMFCTMFVGVLDLTTGTLNYCNAGHNPPILRRIDADGGLHVDYMQLKTNLAVGMLGRFVYKGATLQLAPGEALFLYTDGVTEAEDVHHNLFGEEATLAALATARADNARTAQDFVNKVAQTVNSYASNAEQSDDITMLVVEYKGPVANTEQHTTDA